MSKLSFQYGFSVFLITTVVFVCSPLMVATANGSGNPAVYGVSLFFSTMPAHPAAFLSKAEDVLKTSLLYSPSAAMTVSKR